jgi:hypothetical protein
MSFPGAGRTGQAGGYHRFFSQVTIPVARPLLDAARVTAGSTVLDAGAGPGYAARAGRARGAHVAKDDLKRRIDAAFVDGDQLCLSPQCGLSSTKEGNDLTAGQQWANPL